MVGDYCISLLAWYVNKVDVSSLGLSCSSLVEFAFCLVRTIPLPDRRLSTTTLL